jgi:hypothetical protein
VDKIQDGASRFVDNNHGTPDQAPASEQVPPVHPADGAP